MVSHIVTAIASTLIISCSKPPVNLNLKFRAAVNGVFFCTKTNRLASLVWWHGKEIAPLPAGVKRGGLVCYHIGLLRETFYFRNRRKPKWLNNAIGVLKKQK
jgi:hypothetical protein